MIEDAGERRPNRARVAFRVTACQLGLPALDSNCHRRERTELMRDVELFESRT
jgi:hypothetical protein